MKKKEFVDWLNSVWGILMSLQPKKDDETTSKVAKSMKRWGFKPNMTLKAFTGLFDSEDYEDFKSNMEFYKVKPPRGLWAKLTEAQKSQITEFRTHMEKSGIAGYLDEHYPDFFNLVLRKNAIKYESGAEWIQSIEDSILRRLTKSEVKK